MEAPEQGTQIRVLKVDSKDTWDAYLSQAQGCPIVAHFSAIWCILSVAMNPLIEELASIYQDFLFLSVDVDDVKEVASQYEVKVMPTFIMIKGGTPVDKLIGANPDEIKKRIQALV